MQYNAHVVYHSNLPFKLSGNIETPDVFKAMSLVLRNKAKKALWERFNSISHYQIDPKAYPKGYLTEPAHNLLLGVKLWY